MQVLDAVQVVDVVTHYRGTAKQTARRIALGALFLIPFTPLIVANGFFFPFITGKAFYFRIVVDITVVAWLLLCLLDKAYRPRFSWVGAAVVAFVLWMFVADAFAVNAIKAFWSNFERMEGWVLLAHLAGLFFTASAVLRVEKKWRTWFLISLAVSAVISCYAFFQLVDSTDFPIHQGSTRIDASLGNSAYLAVYLLFSVFVAGWLALTERITWLTWALAALALVESVLIFFTETRGTILALTIAVSLAALLTALTAGKRLRNYAVGALVLVTLLSGFFYVARNSSLVQGNHVLQRVSSISLADGQTRFTIWHMAYEGFLVRPLTGWGQEGFNYVFNRFYDPALYHQEPWFDRAHNAFIDWLSAGGLPAFVLYLALFVSAIWLLWHRSELSRPERIALTCALVGYGIHNLFVFDNISSYIYFFAILALVDSQTARPVEVLEKVPELDESIGMTYALPIAVVVAIALVWVVNVPGIRAATGLITAISPSSTSPAGNITSFERLLARPLFARQEIREQLVSYASAVVQDPSVPDAEKQRAVTLAITEMQKQVARYPLDTREHLQLAYMYRAAGAGADALKEIKTAALLTPTKEEIWLLEGATEWDLGDSQAARASFDKAYALGPQFDDLAAYAAAGAYSTGDTAHGNAILMQAYGTTTVDSQALAIAYLHTKDWPRLIRFWQLRAAAPDASVQSYFSLAAAYYTAGDHAQAIAVIRQAALRFPQAQSAADAAIKQIQSGTVGQ